ncbi:Tox-REase-5 domain-containing protein [Brachybacterium squillarum]|uniref:Tox-REase-5 domain-containing protein n=1 Tax=Brachybacterium squillarum TaxID=661979 RepID=UPI0002629866|nr:Tox-REase-5 domain-containing protein [Brachybacterium squillarum]
MKFDAESKSWVAVNKGEGWGPGGKPLVDPVEFDADAGNVYESGDAQRPGDGDPHTPDEYRDPDSGDGIEHQDRGNDDKPWRRYQEQISGWNRTEDGRIPEYVVHDLDGNKVAFDGRTMRGDQEVFLEAKRGYEILQDAPGSAMASDMMKSIHKQASSQTKALPDGAKLEWHVSSQKGATAIRNVLESEGLRKIDVVFTPEP